ncbi:M-phase phosphoprotein 9 [Neosynchiropus ocellatus]
MSTDDSVSEDASSSTALSHCHGDGAGGKESEASLVSSEGTSASGRVRPRGPPDTTTGCPKIRCVLASEDEGVLWEEPNLVCLAARTLCVSSGQVFRRGMDLPFINPSSLEILRALVREIQSSGETNPEMWKDCEGRWLHLFQLVEKQYQEQIVAQQQQYQRQIQLIQDEIKALVQLQNRQASFQTHSDVSPSSITKWSPDSKDDLLTFADCPAHSQVFGDTDDRTVSVFTGSASPPHHRSEAQNLPGQRAATMLSSGYGTLSAWETGPEAAGSPGEEGGGLEKAKGSFHDRSEALLVQKVSSRTLAPVEDPVARPPRRSASGPLQPHGDSCARGTDQTLTSWAQRQKLRSRRVKDQNQESTDTRKQVQTGPDRPLDGSSPRRSDSAMSELSGLTYWRLHEDDLYRPLPGSLDHDHLQEATSTLEPGLSLRKIYQNKQSGEGSFQSSPQSAQVSTLDPAASARRSDRTSGFTSPSHFSSPSSAAPLGSGPVPSVTPDSMVESCLNLADTDCNSEVSSVSTAGPLLPQDGTRSGSKIRKSSPVRGSGSALDPLVLSLLRQNQRDKHARHVSDLRAYYESEIRTLREQLQLLPEDLDQRNQLLTERCQHLEERVREARQRVRHLEAAQRRLEEQLADWPQRYAVATATIESLQQRLEESRRVERQKDSAVTHLRTRVVHLEEQVRLSRREADETEAQRQREHGTLQGLVGGYDALVKEHAGLKKQLASTEDKLCDANNRIVDLKKTVSKLETQVKQLEHQNRARRSLHRTSQPSGAGSVLLLSVASRSGLTDPGPLYSLFHHPDLLMSPRRLQPEPDVTQRSSPCPSGPGSRAQSPTDTSGWRWVHAGVSQQLAGGVTQWIWCSSPPVREPVQTLQQEQNQRESGRRDLTPMMRALIQLEETKATESRAPWGSGQRNASVSLDQRPRQVREGAGLESAAAVLRARRSLSPEGQRSSSLPPPAQRNIWATPTKRETLLAPVSSKCSPKRCPTDNYSTAFGHMMPREEHLNSRADSSLDRRHSLHCSPRKRLQFHCPTPERLESGATHGPAGGQLGGQEPTSLKCLGTRTLTLSEAQQLCDELTQEKLQIEAALNRVTSPGARVGHQRTSDQVRLGTGPPDLWSNISGLQDVLEKRLDDVTRALVSARRTLKRLKVRTSKTSTKLKEQVKSLAGSRRSAAVSSGCVSRAVSATGPSWFSSFGSGVFGTGTRRDVFRS